MTDFTTFLDNNRKLAIYTGKNIHGHYHYLETIGSPTTLTTSGHSSNNFGSSSSTNNYTLTLQPVIAALRVRQKSICERCKIIGKKFDACIIRGRNFLPTILRIHLNQFNEFHVDEPTEPPREYNSQPLEVHFKSWTSPPKTGPVVLDIMGRLNNHSINNGDVEVYPSEHPFESIYDSVTDPYNTTIKPIDDDEMDQILEFFLSDQNDYILDVEHQMIHY